MGSLWKRGNIWWIAYSHHGTRERESTRYKRKSDAKALLDLREGAIANGQPVTAAMSRFRFEDAVTDLENDYQIKGNRTLGHLQRRIRLHLQPWFGGRRMADISTADVRAFIVHRQTAETDDAGKVTRPAASAGEINRELSILKRAFVLATQAGKLMTRPYIPMLREQNVRTGFFERPEFEAVREHLPAPLQSFVTFAYLTGWRKSEVLGLEWRQVDFDAGIVRLEPGTTKNSEGRTFPFSVLPELKDVLEAQWAYTERTQKRTGKIVRSVFHRGGEPIASFRKAWDAACEAAGCPGRIPHDFRRTAVRNLVRAGVPERTAMLLSGHKTRSVFDRYDIVNEADLAAAVEKLAQLGHDTKKTQSGLKAKVRKFRGRR